MPTYQDDVSRVTAARQKQASLNAQAGQIEAGAMTFGDEIMGKIREARASRGMSKLQQGVGTVTGQLASDPQRIYDYAGADVRPSTVDTFTAKARASNLSTLASQDAMTADIGQTIEEALGAGTNRLLSQAALKKAEADKAKQEADALIEEIRLRMDQEKAKVADTNPMDVLSKIMGGSGGGVSYMDENGQPAQQSNGFGFNPTRDQIAMAMLADPDNQNYYKTLYEYMNPETEKTEDEKGVVTGIINQLKNKYYGEEGSDDDLAKGRIGGAITGLKAAAGKAPTAKRYNELRKGVVTTLKGLVGESGVLTDPDVERIINLLPKTTDTSVEAEGAWNDVFELINNKYGSDYSIVKEI
jgi:hypothetical protein